MKEQPVGIGGGLAVFVVGMLIFGFVQTAHASNPMAVSIGLGNLAVGIMLCVRRANWVVKTTKIWLVVKMVAYGVFTVARLVGVSNLAASHAPELTDAQILVGEEVGNFLMCVLWLLYFVRSKRVKNTYGIPESGVMVAVPE